MTEIPRLARLDHTAHELAVDELGAPAGRTASAACQARGHHRGPPSPSTAVGRGCVLRVDVCAHEPLAAAATESLVVRDRHVFAPAAIAATDAIGERDPRRNVVGRPALHPPHRV
jgi:hypothetical protein